MTPNGKRRIPLLARLAALIAGCGIATAAVAASQTRPAATATGAPSPSTMKAIRYHAHGGPEVLVLEDAPVPKPGAGEMLVRVHAAGVNPVDWKIRKRGFGAAGAKFPVTPGFDLSGVVAVTGEGVTRFRAGDAIYAYLSLRRGGAYAEYAIVREDEAAAKPSSIDHVQAAAIPLAALTAWQALHDAAKLEAGQTVLIHAAAGGVGTFAVQIAKALGATVIGTASAANHAYLREIGADRTVDYRAQRFEYVVRDVDVVLDAIGGDTLERSFKVVKPGGAIVSIVDDPSRVAGRDPSVRVASILVRPNADQLARIAALVDAGTIRPVVSEILPLADARKAHEASETGHTRGKIVLRVVE